MYVTCPPPKKETNISPIERFKHDLCHLLPLLLGVHSRVGEKDGMFFWCDAELIVESVIPDFLHVVPVADDSAFDGVL